MDDAGLLVTALRKMIERAQLDGLGLDVATLVAARDAVERHDRLLGAITRHHFDSTHLASKGWFSLRLADRMLYEEAGLPDISADMGGTATCPDCGNPLRFCDCPDRQPEGEEANRG